MVDRDLVAMDEKGAAFQYIKLQKKASTFKSCIHWGIVTEKERNCSLHGSGETTLGKHSPSPGHCTETGTAHHDNENGDAEQGTGLRGKNKHLKDFALVRTKGDVTTNASESCKLCSWHCLGQYKPSYCNSSWKL